MHALTHDRLPHHPIGALAQALADLEALAHVALDVLVGRLRGHL